MMKGLIRGLGLHYILDDEHNVVPVDDLLEYSQWKAANGGEVHVGHERTAYHWVSTVFLGINHASFSFYERDTAPVVFETMVFEWQAARIEFFGEPAPAEVDWGGNTWRWRTWKEAEEGHECIVSELITYELQMLGKFRRA